MLIVDNLAIPYPYEKSNAPNAQDRYEENVWAAMETLERTRTMQHFPAYHGTWQAWTMHCLKPIARHFEVDADDVLAAWARHYGVGLKLEENDAATD